MSLFEKQSQQNMKDSKKAMKNIAKELVEKHVKLQASFMPILTGAGAVKKGCLKEAILSISEETALIEMQTRIIAEGYHMAFDERLNVRAMTKKAMMKHFPVSLMNDVKPKFKELGEELTGDEIPKEVRDAIDSLKEKLSGSSEFVGNAAIKVKKMSPRELGESYGIDPNNYNNFDDFFKAVKKAAKGTMFIDVPENGESAIKDAVIKQVEDEAEAPKPRRRRGSDEDTDKSKLN